MKLTQSLIALIQFVAICQIVFGLVFVPLNFESGESAIIPQIRDERVAETVVAWHQRTILTAQRWCLWSGVVTFCLATGVARSLRRCIKEETAPQSE